MQLALYQMKEKGDPAIEPVMAELRQAVHRRAVPERRGARQPGDAPDEASRDQHRSGRRQRLRPREEEPAARARDRRRLPAGVQPARALLPRDGQAEGGSRRSRRKTATFSEDEEGRPAAARARGARVLASHSQEPELRGDPQHRGPHPGRAAEHQRRRARVPDRRPSSIRRSSRRR